jgi:hypothetical protein
MVLLGSLSHSLASTPLKFVENGRSAYRIVLDPQATDSDRRAAEELQKYVERVAGARLSVVEATIVKGGPAVWVLSAGHAGSFRSAIDWNRLEDDGFTIKTDGDRLIIAGGKRKGSLYGVYTFLETYLGCRKYSPTVEFTPKQRTIVLPTFENTQVPPITFRDGFFYDPGYMDWHKLDNHDDLFGMYVHTFRTLVPPEKYFSEHPEYFTKLKAGRIPDAQLCLTNPDVFRIVVQELKERMRQKPEVRYWSVSQNDTFSPCECVACKAIDSVEGSPSGSLLAFVNRVADAFPDKVISTLAYQYSRAAPATIKPRANVNIMLCSIECNRSRPLAADPGSASFVKDVSDWGKLTDNIYLWDYVVQFRNLISPFPNLRVLQPNVQFFVKNGIRSVFEQGSGSLPNEFKELRTYLIAKLLWNPNANVDSLMSDFLSGFYGKASPFLRQYIETMHDALKASGEELTIYGYPLPSKRGYLSPENMDRYIAFFDRAEESVKGDTAVLRRVQRARLPLQFALLEQAKVYGTGERGFYARASDGTWSVKPSMMKLLETFVERCNDGGIKALEEMGRSPDEYVAATKQFLETSMKNPRGLFRPVTLVNPASSKYKNGEASALTDGLRGWADYNMNWLGFEGEDMEATIDLGSLQPVRKITSGFLQDVNAWVFMPLKVEFAVSSDGQVFRTVAELKDSIPANVGKAFVRPFIAEVKETDVRYVRVRAVNMKTCPLWHKGAGGPAWIFADEITVE